MLETTDKATEHSEKLLLRAAEVGRSLSIGTATVYQMIASGELPTVRIGRSVRVPVKALAAWIKERTK